ncbi:MAG: hypothetical protein GWP19_00835 [Planctomycetia bacterium]|nr:hypothetical protein [Planctomycetia bacterium]
MTNQILIGGQALRQLGSNRTTEDIDFLINDKSDKRVFITSDKVDYLNAANNKFFAKIWAKEEGNTAATPESLLELKAYAFVQHCQNFNWEKVASTEFDMKFLVLKFKLNAPKIVKGFVNAGEYSEIEKIVNFNK